MEEEKRHQAMQEGMRIMEEWKERSKKRRVYRLFLTAALALAVTAFLGMSVYGITRRIPSTIYFRAGRSQCINLKVPATGEVRTASAGRESNVPKEGIVINLSGPVTMQTAGRKRYDMQVRLFGILPLKKVDIRVIEDHELIPMGIPIGIYLKSKGIMVIGTAEFEAKDGSMVSPAQNILRSGDLILELNGRAVSNKEELIGGIENCRGREILLTIERGGKEECVRVRPVLNQSGKYKAGIWVRDDAQGVGTLTYVDEEGRFGALGHGIADVDTGVLVEAEEGSLYQTKIVRLRKGEHGQPGEMTGRITYEDEFLFGEIRENSDRGVYGTCSEDGMKLALKEAGNTVCKQGMTVGEPVPIALKQEIEIGPATIICTLEDRAECFDVEITRVKPEGAYVNRGIELRVTDEELLQRTGGIVQGMSGSPILQNGRIIGAVTHVLVNAPEKGYGIFIENMLDERQGN